MRELKPGLFAMPSLYEMPVRPKELARHVVAYLAPNSLGKAEDEEAAVRLVWPSVEADQWVGVTWERIVRQMQAEHEAECAVQAARNHNFEEEWLVRARREKFWVLSVITLGVYALFANYPMPDLMAVPQHEEPAFSLVPLYGPSCIVDAFSRLIDLSLIVVRKEGDTEVLFPTPELISHLGAA